MIRAPDHRRAAGADRVGIAGGDDTSLIWIRTIGVSSSRTTRWRRCGPSSAQDRPAGFDAHGLGHRFSFSLGGATATMSRGASHVKTGDRAVLPRRTRTSAIVSLTALAVPLSQSKLLRSHIRKRSECLPIGERGRDRTDEAVTGACAVDRFDGPAGILVWLGWMSGEGVRLPKVTQMIWLSLLAGDRRPRRNARDYSLSRSSVRVEQSKFGLVQDQDVDEVEQVLAGRCAARVRIVVVPAAARAGRSADCRSGISNWLTATSPSASEGGRYRRR